MPAGARAARLERREGTSGRRAAAGTAAAPAGRVRARSDLVKRTAPFGPRSLSPLGSGQKRRGADRQGHPWAPSSPPPPRRTGGRPARGTRDRFRLWARHGSTLRANPCPEVTDLTCRLPLPTLIYRPEAEHLGDLLRSKVRTAPPQRGRAG
ncbi:uncharacterized protein LOC119571649 [Penaeus monodon]|uniref:uncharacterized protein LOC119571649 n=1 Tax=Penaeus monodon TaxID=6687 RepID=UPI0018A76429|nr:uncharacterized protein LOC119571649 [Penaeus monodon]